MNKKYLKSLLSFVLTMGLTASAVLLGNRTAVFGAESGLDSAESVTISFENGIHSVANPADSNRKMVVYCMNNQMLWPHDTGSLGDVSVPKYLNGYLTASDFASEEKYEECMDRLESVLYAGYPYNGESMYEIVENSHDYIPTDAQFDAMLVPSSDVVQAFPELKGHTFTLASLKDKSGANYKALVKFNQEVIKMVSNGTEAEKETGKAIQQKPFFKAANSVVMCSDYGYTAPEYYSAVNGGEYFVTEEQAVDGTQHAVWLTLHDYGIEGNNLTPSAANALGKVLYEHAKNDDVLKTAPKSSNVSFGGDMTFRKDEASGKWVTGRIKLSEPDAYDGEYSLQIPTGMTLEKNDKSTETTIRNGEEFRLVSDEKPSENAWITASAKVQWLQEMKQYRPAQEVTVNGKKFQRMIGAMVETASLQAPLFYWVKTDPTDVTPSVEKKITGGNPAKDSTFHFTINGKDNAPMPEGSKDGKKTVTITGEGNADFGKITFTKAGTYTYKVTEQPGSESSYNYDSTEYTLTYKVTDVRGELKAEQSITAGDKSADKMVFTNEYAPASMDGDTAITGTKELVGRSMQKDEKFEFTMKAGDEATQKAIDEKDIVLNGTHANLSGMRDGQKSTFSFGRAEFSKEGEYTFTVAEKDGGKAGMTYDTKEKTFKVKVAKENGIMTAVQEEVPTFRNTYEASGEYTPAGTKTLLSENGNKLSVKDNQFKFSVYYTGHTDGEAVTTGTTGNGKDAEIGFGKLSYTISDLEKLVAKGYADKTELDNGARYYIDYVVIENASDNSALQANTQSPTFRVEITDNGDGTLTAKSEEGSKIAFENLYKSDKATVHFNGQKALEGRPLEADEFTFKVTSDEENAPMPEKTEVKNEEGGTIDFGTITYGKDDLGDATEKTFTYQVKESGEQPGVANDTENKTVKVTVKDDGKGHITAETDPNEAPLFAFNNTYSTTSKESSVSDTVKIRKTLTGRKLKDKEFNFVLKDEDGKTVAEAKNNADGSVVFKNLTFDKVGTYNYSVKEVKGNAKHVTYDANAYTVTAIVTDNLDGTLSVVSVGLKSPFRVGLI